MSVRRTSLTWGLVGAVAYATVLSAQNRVPIRPTPKPGQVIHVTTQQEILMRAGERPEEPGPAIIETKNLISYTQTNGTFNAQGNLDAQIVVDRLETSESYAGKPRKAPDPEALKGRVLLITFDRTGKLLGIKVPPEIKDVSSTLTQLLAGAYGMVNSLPQVELAVGEQATSTTELPMRMPGSPTSAPFEARTNFLLRAVEAKGGSRIARLQQDMRVDTASSQANFSGSGTVDVNTTKGFVSAAETEWKISGTIPAAAGSTKSTPFFGFIKIRISAN